MATIDILQARRESLQLTIKNVNASIREVNCDIDFPHTLRKRLPEIEKRADELARQLGELSDEKRRIESRLDPAGQETELQACYVVKDATTSELVAVDASLKAVLDTQAQEKALAPDIKQFAKLARSFTREELLAMFTDILNPQKSE